MRQRGSVFISLSHSGHLGMSTCWRTGPSACLETKCHERPEGEAVLWIQTFREAHVLMIIRQRPGHAPQALGRMRGVPLNSGVIRKRTCLNIYSWMASCNVQHAN